MGIIDRKDIQAAYKKEASSLLRKINKGLFLLNKQQITNNELRTLNYELQTTNYKLQIFRLFRYAHTLKGISGICGYYKIEAAAKSVEDVFRAAKDKKLEISVKDKSLIKKKLKECEKFLSKSA